MPARPLVDVDTAEFIRTLHAVANQLSDVQPIELRASLRLWFLGVAEQARRERWPHLLGVPVMPVWGAACAILDSRIDAQP